MVAQPLPQHTQSPEVYVQKGVKSMSQSVDNQGNALPQWDEIIATWLSPAQVAEMAGTTTRAIQIACTEGRLRAVKFGHRYRGSWYVHPEAAAQFSKYGKQPPTEEGKNGEENDEG